MSRLARPLGLWLGLVIRHRGLLKNFIAQDIKSRHAGSYLGVLWLIASPMATMAVYVLVFSTILKLRLQYAPGLDNFVVYLLSGLIPWLMFSDAINRSPQLLIQKASLITKVSFPVPVLPYATVLGSALINGIALLLFCGYLLLTGSFGLHWLWLPLIVGFQLLFTLGLVALLSSFGVFFRDLVQIVGFTLQLWFYLTPIFYPLSLVPEAYQWVFQFNPMWAIIESYHQILLMQTAPDLNLLISAATISVGAFCLWGWLFIRFRTAFSDVL